MMYDNPIEFQRIANPTFKEEKKQMNTIEDIIEWIEEYDNPSENVENLTGNSNGNENKF